MLDKFGQLFGPARDAKNNAGPGKSEKHARSTAGNPPPEIKLNGPALEKLLHRLAVSPQNNRYPQLMSLYENLLHSMVLIPVPSGTDIRKGIPLMTLENSNGEKGVPVFTSEEAMAMWVTEETEYVGLPFPILCTHAVQANLDFVVLNLAGPSGGELTHYEFTYLAENLIPPPREDKTGEIVIEKDTEVRLARAEELSPLLLERLTAVFRQRTDLVARVYAFQVAFSQGPLKTGFGVQLKDGNEGAWETELWPNVQAVLQEVLGAKEYVNVFLLNSLPDLEKTVKEVSTPFYTAS